MSTAEHPPSETVVALHPSEPSPELANIAQQVKGFDSRSVATELMITAQYDYLQSSPHPFNAPAPAIFPHLRWPPSPTTWQPDQASMKFHFGRVGTHHHNRARISPDSPLSLDRDHQPLSDPTIRRTINDEPHPPSQPPHAPPSTTSATTPAPTDALIPSPDCPREQKWKFIRAHRMRFRCAFGLRCREDTCTYIHGLLPPGFFRIRSNFTGRGPPKPAFAALANTPEELAAIDLLDYFVHGEEQGNNHSPQDEQCEQDIHRYLNHQQEEDEEEMELVDEVALSEDLMFS